jgi:hypothetical protein
MDANTLPKSHYLVEGACNLALLRLISYRVEALANKVELVLASV